MEFFDLLQKDSTEFMEYYVYVFKLFTRRTNEFPISLLRIFTNQIISTKTTNKQTRLCWIR